MVCGVALEFNKVMDDNEDVPDTIKPVKVLTTGATTLQPKVEPKTSAEKATSELGLPEQTVCEPGATNTGIGLTFIV